MRTHAIDDRSPRGQYAESRESPAIDDGCSIDNYLEFAVMSMNHVHIDLQRTPNERRHTDGMESRNSKRTVTDRHSGHGCLLVVSRASAFAVSDWPTRASCSSTKSHHLRRRRR